VAIRPVGLLALALTVWVIYTADHLRDAYTIGKSASTLRHRFHQEHFRTLLIAALAGVLVNVVIVFFIRKQVFVWGTVLAIGVGIYLIVQRYLKFLKEICIACLYTCGVLLPSITVTGVKLTTAHCLLIVQFMMVAWLNLLIFSWFDREDDKQDRQPSFVTMLGEPVTRASIWCLIGSANWDVRSFRLNFELNVEIYHADIVRKIDELMATRRGVLTTAAELDRLPLPVKLIDNAARLMLPYL